MSTDHKASIIVLGESGVGKTSILLRFTRGVYKDHLPITIIDCLHAKLAVKTQKVRLEMWDTGGQDRFRTIVRQYYRKADGVLLIYDVTDISSFHKLSSWLSELRENNENAVVVIVGNKTDHPDNKAVALHTVRRFAENENLEFFQTSAKTGENIYQIFERLAFKVLQARGVFPPPSPPATLDTATTNDNDTTTRTQEGRIVIENINDTQRNGASIMLSEADNDRIKLQAEPQSPKKKKGCCG